MEVSPTDTVGAKVSAVECKDFCRTERLCRDDEGGIGKVHRVVAILFHEFERAHKSGNGRV